MNASFHSNFSHPPVGNSQFLMIETVKKILGIGKKNTGIKLIVSCERLEKRVALLENNRLEEYTTERESDRNIVGAIYKGKVRNIEQGHQGDVRGYRLREECFSSNSGMQSLPPWTAASKPSPATEARKKGQKITHKDVPKIYPAGFGHPRAGKERADRQQGTAHHDRHQPGGAIPRADALQRSMWHFKEDRRSQGARAASEGSSRSRNSRWHGRDHSHRRSRPAGADISSGI